MYVHTYLYAYVIVYLSIKTHDSELWGQEEMDRMQEMSELFM